MSNHNKIRPVDKSNLNGKYKILFSTPQSKNSNIPMEFRGLQIYNSKSLAEIALKKRKSLTKVLLEKNQSAAPSNKATSKCTTTTPGKLEMHKSGNPGNPEILQEEIIRG